MMDIYSLLKKNIYEERRILNNQSFSSGQDLTLHLDYHEYDLVMVKAPT